MAREQGPLDWTGTRTVIKRESSCGWCMDGFHDRCNHEIGWYEKLYVCGCKCNVDWTPVAVVVEKKAEQTDAKKRKE